MVVTRDLPSTYERYPVATLHGIFSLVAAKYPNREAVRGASGRESRTFRELQEEVYRLKTVLTQKGIRAGDVVATFVVKQDWRCVCTQLAISSCGACFVCFDPLATPVKQMIHCLNDTQAVALIHESSSDITWLAGRKILTVEVTANPTPKSQALSVEEQAIMQHILVMRKATPLIDFC